MRTRSGRLGLVHNIVGLVILAFTSIAGAESSFTSAFMQVGPDHSRGNDQDYSGARLFSEDDRSYQFRMFGCVYSLQYPVEGNDLGAQYINSVRHALQPLNADKSFAGRYQIVARLIKGRPFDLSEVSKYHRACDDNGSVAGIGVFTLDNFPNHLGVMVFETTEAAIKKYYDADPASRTGLNPTEYTFGMNKDIFTPEQQRRVNGAMSEIAVAIAQALIESSANHQHQGP